MNQFGMAQPVRRVEDPRLLRGNGCYTDDIALPGTVHGVVLRSPHAAAKLRAVDAAAARAMPGVLAIHTGADLAPTSSTSTRNASASSPRMSAAASA